MKRALIIVFVAGALLIAACGAEPQPTTPFESPVSAPTTTPESSEAPVGLPNPASVHCEEQGYTLEMREEAGGTAGYCIFPDGTECEEWAYYRGECAPGTPKP
jgi:putative hemolysin